MVGSSFDALDAATSSAVVDLYGETAHIIPRRAGQYSVPGGDSDRPPVAVVAVLSISPGADDMFFGRDNRGSRIGHNESEVWLPKAEALKLGFKMQKGDKVSFPERDPPLEFTIAIAHQTDMGDMQLIVTKEGVLL